MSMNNMVKKYWLFGGFMMDDGLGAEGLIGKFETLEKAMWYITESNKQAEGKNNDRYRWANVLNIETGKPEAYFDNPFFEIGEWRISQDSKTEPGHGVKIQSGDAGNLYFVKSPVYRIIHD